MIPPDIERRARWVLDSIGAANVGFGDDVTTQGLWQPSDAVAFRAQILSGLDRTFKWRAGTYATYTNFGWKWGPTHEEQTPARSVLLADDTAGDAPTGDERREINFRVIPAAFSDPTILGPNTLYSVDRPTNALVVGSDGWFTTVEATDSAGTYNVSARIPVYLDVTGGLTEQRLRLAGTDYPADLMALSAVSR